VWELHLKNMAWLSGYNKRIKVTADHTKVGSNLSWFPLTIFLKSGDGDTTKIFDELGSNNLKMAITKSDGTTQLYVEIEQWDTTNKVGVLHCGRDGDTLSSSADTDYYIYYDSSHADNTDYVGVKNSTPAQSVWDDNFKAIYHMSDGADTSHIYDSTSNNNDGTKKGANEPIEADGKVAKAQDFDGTDDWVDIPYNFGKPNTITIELWFKTSAASWGIIFGQADAKPPSRPAAYVPVLTIKDTGVLRAELWNGTRGEISTTFSVKDGNWHHAVIVGNTNTQSLYVDNQSIGSRSGTIDQSWWTYSTIGTGFGATSRGFPSDAWYYFNGLIDEVRISNVARSADWIKATYYSLNNSLLTYGAEETNANFFPFF